MNILLELFMIRPGSDIAIYINSEKSGIRAICDEKGPPKLRLKEVFTLMMGNVICRDIWLSEKYCYNEKYC